MTSPPSVRGSRANNPENQQKNTPYTNVKIEQQGELETIEEQKESFVTATGGFTLTKMYKTSGAPNVRLEKRSVFEEYQHSSQRSGETSPKTGFNLIPARAASESQAKLGQNNPTPNMW